MGLHKSEAGPENRTHMRPEAIFGANRMAQTTNKRRNVSFGGGSKRQAELEPLVGEIVKISKAAQSKSVISIRKSHAVASVGNIDITIRAPLHLRLNAASERRYLKTLFASERIEIPFQLDVWTSFRKVLNVEYDGGALIIVSFRRGPWEDSITSASKTASIPCGELVIKPRPSIKSARDLGRSDQENIVITQKVFNMIRDTVLRDKPSNPLRRLLR
jgi:hypothetical protein